MFTFMKWGHGWTQLRSSDLGDAFIFYCCVANYYKLSGSQQQTFHGIVSVGQKSRHSSAPLSAQDLISLQSMFWTDLEAWTGNGLLPSSSLLLGEFISLWLEDWGSLLLLDCQLEASHSSQAFLWAVHTTGVFKRISFSSSLRWSLILQNNHTSFVTISKLFSPSEPQCCHLQKAA